MNTQSSTLPRCPKYRQSLKNYEESHCSANSTFGQGTIISAYLWRTRTKPVSKQTKVYSNGLSCHSDYAMPRPLLQGCSTKSSARYMPGTLDCLGITWMTLSS